MSVLVETTLGDLVFDLYTEERPRSCLNFLKLCKIKYYNYCLFHSVRRNFIAQSGDPTGSGRGGVSVYTYVYGDQAKYFDLELKPRIKHRTKGTISFVNNGNDMHGSQFFITLGDGLDFLDGKHTVFGQLAEGFDILEKLNETICDDTHKPYQDVRITHTIILEDPFDDPKGLPIPEHSPEPTKEQLASGLIGADEEIDDTKGKSKEEIQKDLDDKELNIGTKILETVGDIDDADLKPPDNVLFVCKLNPITNADDLKIIFSRFGKILSCEIIKDQKTGDSLCYGFVEFKEVEACEKAYFKMDNVLIDDRRIHVDFCQSVAKIRKKWQKSSMYKSALKEKETSAGYKMKQMKKKEKYSMVFEDDSKEHLNKKKKEKKKVEPTKKKYDSQSEDEGDQKERKRTSKTKKGVKPTRQRSVSSSSETESEEEKPSRKQKPSTENKSSRRREDEKRKKSVDRKRSVDRKKVREDRDSSSEEELRKKAPKKTKDIDRQHSDRNTKLKKRLSRPSSSEESADEIKKKPSTKSNQKSKEKKKTSKYSDDSDSESDEDDYREKKSGKDKALPKKKRYHSSSEEDRKSDKMKTQKKAGVQSSKQDRSLIKKSKYESSDDEYEKKKRVRKDDLKQTSKSKNKYDSSSEEEYGKESKKTIRSSGKKPTGSHKGTSSKAKKYDDSDTEEYTLDEDVQPKQSSKVKRRRASPSSDDSGKHHDSRSRRKRSHSRNYSSSEDDSRKKKTSKSSSRVSSSKKKYKRRDEYSDSSD